MIADALKFLTDLGSKSAGFKKLETPTGGLLVQMPDGSVQNLDPRIPNRQDTLATLDSLIGWISDQEGVCEVFVAETEVTAIIARKGGAHSDSATLPLRYAKAWVTIVDWIRNPKLQVEVVRLLRGPLRGCCSDGLLAVFRSLEFRSGSESARTIKGPSADSLGRSAHREALSNGQDLPDTLGFNVPVYDIHSSPDMTIPVAVDVDYDAERIRLLEIGDALRNAMESSQRWIAGQIDDQTPALVYHGSYKQV